MLWSKSKLEKTFKLKASHSRASSPEELAMLRLQGWSPDKIEEFVNVSVHGLSIVNRCTLWCTSNVRCVLWGTFSIYSQRESNLRAAEQSRVTHTSDRSGLPLLAVQEDE